MFALWLTTAGIATLLNGGEAVGGAWFSSLLCVETYVFFAWFWLTNSATLGMQAWHLRIQTITSGRITLRQSALRWFAAMLALLPLGLGYLWILFDSSNRSWQDILSDTQIIYQKPD